MRTRVAIGLAGILGLIAMVAIVDFDAARSGALAAWSQIKAIRVLGAKALTVRSSHSHIVHAGHEAIELGTVPIAPDGSFSIEVTADMPLALQAVDAEGRSELNEMSWIYVRPGEQRGCVGCHHKRQVTPLDAGEIPLALKTRPLDSSEPA